MKNTQTELNCIQDDNSHPMSVYELIAEFHKAFNDEDEEELCSIRNETYTNNSTNSNEEIELRSIIDNAPIAEFSPFQSSNFSEDNKNIAIENEKNFQFQIEDLTNKEIELRTIIDDSPIAELSPSQSPFFNLSQDNENIVIENKKIFPFKIEDLEKLYNNKRFPDRIRREARVLKIYNTLANYSVVTVYLLFEANKKVNKKSKLTHYANLAHQVIDAPVNSLKAKISQLARFDYMDKNPQISYGLIYALNDISHINPQILWNIIKNHDKVDALEEIKKLINKDKQC